MNLEDKLGLGRTLLEVIHRAKGDIEQYHNTLKELLHKDKRSELSHSTITKLSTEFDYAKRLYKMERNIKAKFTITPHGVVLKPYVPEETQRIPVYRPGLYDGD